MPSNKNKPAPAPKKPSVFGVLKGYQKPLLAIVALALMANVLNLWIPKLVAQGINHFENAQFNFIHIAWQFSLVVLFIFLFGLVQNIIQTKLSERVARDLRQQIIQKISTQNFEYIQQVNPNKLLTNVTSDVDGIKMFVSQALVSVISAAIMIIGASIMVLSLNWKLGLIIMLMIPAIGTAFFLIFKRVRNLFKKSQEVIDRLNKVISENILAAALVRILNAQIPEYNKFIDASDAARNIGLGILRLFALLIPIIIFISNMAVLSVVLIGGHFVISNQMNLGDFTAFYSYISILIFPILIIGFMSGLIARASASYGRIMEVLKAEITQSNGTIQKDLEGNIRLKNIDYAVGDKKILKNISLEIKAHQRTAIIGPTSAGKSVLVNIMAGLLTPNSGSVYYDQIPLTELDTHSFLAQTGIVFQENVVFNTNIEDNISFQEKENDPLLQKALQTADLSTFVAQLPAGLKTPISEKGTSLSGGQKQRLMLARALAINPKILLLDDFTARVDNQTEENIWQHLAQNYPGLTIVSVMQKMNSIASFDHIILLMEGELVAAGNHPDLLAKSPEYKQLFEAQQSIETH